MIEYKQLDLLNERQMSYIPPHFSIFHLDDDLSFSYKDQIINWIREKLSGRYTFIKSLGIDSSQRYRSFVTVGFEKPAELTYFIISCPYIRRT